MITKEQAILLGEGKISGEIHYNGCSKKVGPRGGVKTTIERWRVNGMCKVWVTRPNEFRLPIVTGFRGPYSYLTEYNCMHYHLLEDCPLLKEEKESGSIESNSIQRSL